MSLLLLLRPPTEVPAAAGHFKGVPLLGLGAFGAPVAEAVNVNPAKGTLTLAGKVATLTQPQSVTPAKGALTLTGRQPTIAQTANQSLEPAKGTLTLSGSVATVAQTANQSIAAIVGHLTATGYAPGVARGDNQSIGPPQVGHLTLGGQTATLSQPQSATPTTGSLSLTGYVPSVTQAAPQGGFWSLPLFGFAFGADTGAISVTPAKGALTLTGYVPVVGRDQDATPTNGALTLGGKVATVGNQEILIEWDDVGADEGYRVKWGTSSGVYAWSADVATDVLQYEVKGLTWGVTYYIAVFALVGGVEQEASAEQVFTAGIWHLPTKGSLTLGGKVPTVVQSVNQAATPTKGNLALGGKVATVVQSGDQAVTPVKGNLALGGKVPTVGATQSREPATGHLTLTGYAPTVGATLSLIPTAGALSLGGKVATVAQTASQWLTPTSASLTLTGYAPTLQIDGPLTVDPQTGSLLLNGYAPTITGPNFPRGRGAGGSGRGDRKPKRVIWVEPEDEGPVVEVESAAEVPKAVKSIKRQAKAIATKAIANREPIPELPKWVVHGDAPWADELRRRIREVEANFAYVYQLMLIEQRRRDEEDEDEALLLLL